MSKKKTIYIKKSDAYRCAESECDYKTMMLISQLPAEDVKLVKRGKWIISSDEYYYHCSKCKYVPNGGLTNYCPNCGAYMKGDEKNE